MRAVWVNGRLVWLLTLSILLLSTSLNVRGASDDDDGDVQDDDDTAESSKKPEPKQQKEQYKPPTIPSGTLMAETFDGSVSDVFSRWVKSKAKKSAGDRYDGQWGVEQHESSAINGDVGLIVKTKAKHHAIASKLSSPFDFTNSKQFVVQYEVKFAQGMDCGGAYMKLLSTPLENADQFYDKSPFTIMFGPDKCGNDNKLHFIIRFPNPKTGKFEEKHMKKPDGLDVSKLVTDKKTHLFTLILSGDGAFEVLVDQKRVKAGSLNSLEDFDPPLVPPAEIDDPKDKKPKDWDDRPKIADPESKKPEDWDENEPEFIIDPESKKPDDWLEKEEKMIKDPLATKPDDWEDDMDGEWEAPLIDNPKCAGRSGCGKWEATKLKNPKYKGKWSAPLIPNPAYKGEWKARRIPNPDFFEEKDPYSKLSPIAAIGFELWTMTDQVVFDNILVADNKAAAEQFAKESWLPKSRAESSGALSVLQAALDALTDRPWLWVVVIVVVAIPCALLIAYCCFSGNDNSARLQAEAAARRKKTDAAAEDDALIEDEDEDDDDAMPDLEPQDAAEEEQQQEVRQRPK